MDLPRRIVLLKQGFELSREEQLIHDYAAKHGVPVSTGAEKQMMRGRVPLEDEPLVCGSIPFIKHAMRILGIELPKHTPYPSAIAEHLHRKVVRWLKLSYVLSILDEGERLFVKPADDWKRFTGFVAEYSTDPRFQGASRSMAVWTSEPVNFLSKWRAYVAEGKVLDIRFADHGGDRSKTPDEKIIHGAVAALKESGEGVDGYVIDFGVLDSGQTALVEVNDGFSCGAYDGVRAETLFKVYNARWQELLKERKRL